MKDAPDECGQYTTLWGKNDRGEWKYLLDIGNTHACAPLEKNPKIITIEKYDTGRQGSQEKLSQKEKEFIVSFGQNTRDAYLKYGSTKYILNLAQHHPVMSRDSAVLLLNKMGTSLKYHPASIKISPGKDMAAAYFAVRLIYLLTGNFLNMAGTISFMVGLTPCLSFSFTLPCALVRQTILFVFLSIMSITSVPSRKVVTFIDPS
jgi:hypothetical protein